jgi:hypothetical protein
MVSFYTGFLEGMAIDMDTPVRDARVETESVIRMINERAT